MSHRVGTVQVLTPAIAIGPDAGDSTLDFAHVPAPTGTKFLILHFQNASFPANNRLEVDLGYDMDVFTSADGDQFWTRPVNISALPGGLVPIRYITNGSPNGSVEFDQYGRGERQPGVQDPTALSNCDPFLGDAVYVEPDYDPFWYCADPPNWENIACVPADVRTQVARSVGMIVAIHDGHVSTCSVTLVDADKVITAGHCTTIAESETASVTFDYRTECDGSRPAGYNARFHKVSALLEHRWSAPYDYALLRLATAPPGIPVIQLRHDIPAPGEQVFGVHHPNGAVKKVSIPSPGFATVQASDALNIAVPSNVHVSGGSSGSGLFDLAGRIVGILSRGDPCGNIGGPDPLLYFPTGAYLLDTVPTPPPPVTRDVMVVIDRSGSMSEDDGTGRQKIETARDAVSLFVQLVQSGTGNRVGLVSFSSAASAPVDFPIADVTGGNKTTLIGPAPYSGGVVGGLSPGGATSIGDGLDEGRLQFPVPVSNPRSILLLTDGMQNTPPLIDNVDDDLGAIGVHAIGFGTASNLDEDLLDDLATAQSGLYMRAGNGLALEKFFTEAFGNIFEAGVLFDPEFDLPANQDGDPVAFPVCGEELITAVVGWDRTDATLLLEITTPGGAVITSSTAGVEAATGITWAFIKVPLPHGAERNGEWKVRVVRPFIPPIPVVAGEPGRGFATERGGAALAVSSGVGPALRYFLDVIPTGGPRLRRAGETRRRYYTGDAVNPLVMLRYDDGSWPSGASLDVTLSRPNAGIGNILTGAGLRPPANINGDVIPAIQASLKAIENATGQPVTRPVETSFTLGANPRDTGGVLRSGVGVYGRHMTDELVVDGNYTFHVRARYAEGCAGARELTWSVPVVIGIDGDNTGITSVPTGTRPDGTECFRLTLTPRDRYGNHLGPGRVAGFEVQPRPGTTVTSSVTDLGNGSYRVDICWDPASGHPPGVGILQPDRPVVVLNPPDVRLYCYSVKFLCGEQQDKCCDCAPVRPGRYATEINIHNPHDRDVKVAKQVIPIALAGAVSGREPRVATVKARDAIALPPHGATMDDCCRLLELLLGAKPSGPLPLSIGILEIISPVELAVTAVYTVTDLGNTSTSIDVETIAPRALAPRARTTRLPAPDALPPTSSGPARP